MPDDHPHVGAVAARFRPATARCPAFVAIPEIIKDAAVNEFPGQNAGFLGPRFGPLLIEHDAVGAFRVPDLALPADVTDSRLQRRLGLQQSLGRMRAELDAGPARDWGDYYRTALDLLDAPAVRAALAIDREPEAVRSRYGEHLFGRGCLLARRLLEAGVPFVTVYWHYEGPDDSPVWDTHWNNFAHLRTRLMPPTDRALAALLDDLAARGMLSDTLVVGLGEFGRTPRINAKAGRDHWAPLQSIVMAGAGVPAGAAYGASDRNGAYPVDSPVSPADLMATWLHLLGVPEDSQVPDRAGRRAPVCTGTVIPGLLA